MRHQPTGEESIAAGHAHEIDLQGHRGARGLLPENTIPGMLLALDLGVTTLEMDVVVTKDRQVVLSHEPWFSSAICSLPSGEPVSQAEEKAHRIYDLTYTEVARYDCGSRGNPRFPRQKPLAIAKPLLSDVIAAAERHAREQGRPAPLYNIETKSTPEGDRILHPEPAEFAGLLYDVVVESGVRFRTTIQSFDPRTLRAVRARDPEVALALLIEADADAGLEGNLKALGFTPAVYSPEFTLVDRALVQQAHARGMKIVPWTVNSVEEMTRLVALGVDGIITDYPDLGREVVGQWPVQAE